MHGFINISDKGCKNIIINYKTLSLFWFTGTHDWVGSDFAINAGVGLVVRMKDSTKDTGATILEHIKASFERDWRSRYAKNLQKSKDQQGKYRLLQWSKSQWETKEEKEWNNPL